MAYDDVYSEEDRRRALTQGLLGAGLAMLGARKGSEFNAFGQAGLLGLGGYNTALRDATNAREEQAMRKMREQQFAMQRAQWEQAQAEREGMRQAHQAAIIPAVPGGEAEPREGGMTPGLPGGFNDAAYINALRTNPNIDPSKALAYQQAFAKPTKELSRIEKLKHAGKMVSVAFYKDGTREILPFDPEDEIKYTDTPPPKGSAPGLQWQRGSDGKLYAVGSQPPVTNINLGGPKWEGTAGGFVYPPTPENPTGKVVVPPGMPAKEAKPLTETQSNAAGFGMRAAEANNILNQLEDSGAPLGSLKSLLPKTKIGNYVAPDWAQKAHQAKLNFMTANLRKESGASISPTEYATQDEMYFPQPGDGPEVLQQKRKMRALAIDTLTLQAGPGGEAVRSRAQAEAPPATPKATKSETMPDVAKVPEGTVVIHDQTGVRLIKRNGKWELQK